MSNLTNSKKFVLQPNNVIPDITNPQSWNAYTYVKGNPVNFNDLSGHYCKAGGTSQVLFGPGGALGLSAAYGGMWENSQEKGTMLGTAVGFEGTAEFSGTERIEGYWKYVPQWAENIAKGEGPFVENGMVGDVATAQQVSETGMVVHGATWVYVSYGGGGSNYTEMRAQPIPKTYVSSLPPYRFHWDRFLNLNLSQEGMLNTLANVTAFTVLGGGIGVLSGGPVGGAVGIRIGMVAGLIISEIEYIELSIYREGWTAPPGPSQPPPGLGSFNLEPQKIQPPLKK